MGSTCICSSPQFQETGIKPKETGRFAWRRGFSGLRYARHTEIHSNTKLRSRDVLPRFLSRAVRERQEERAEFCGRGKRNMADSREVMNIRQASQYLGVSPDTLYKYVGEQKIPAFKLGNRWRFKKSKLDQWMEEKSNEMEAQAKKKPKAAESCRVVGTSAGGRWRNKGGHMFGFGIEDDCWSGCGLLEHQGGGAEERARQASKWRTSGWSHWLRTSWWTR